MAISRIPPLFTVIGDPPAPERAIDNVLPTEMLQKVIHATVELMETEKPGSSWKQIPTLMRLNKRLERETISYLEHQSMVGSDRGGEHVDRLLCLLMRKYYEAGEICSLDEYLSRPSKEPHHQRLLELVQTKLEKSRSIRMGLVHSRELKNSGKIRAPAYWPAGGIDPCDTHDFLCLIKERTDLKSLQVGVKCHGQEIPKYDLPAVPYDQDFSAESAIENLCEIVATLAEVRKKNPDCDVSLSIDWGEFPPQDDQIIMTMQLQLQFLEAWKKYSGVTTLNIIGGNFHLWHEIAGNAKNDEQIRMLRFHHYDEEYSTEENELSTAFLCNAMQSAERPISIAYHFHPGSRHSIMFTAEQIQNMITSFANSKNAQSLLLEVHEDRMREVLESLNDCDVGERIPFHLLVSKKNNDEQMRVRKELLEVVKTLCEDELEEFKRNRELKFEFEVRHIDIKSEKEKQVGIWDVFSDFEIFLTKKDEQ